MRTQDQEKPAVAQFARFMEAQGGAVWSAQKAVDLESVPLVGVNETGERKRGDFDPGPDTNKILLRQKSGLHDIGPGRNLAGSEGEAEKKESDDEKRYTRALYAGLSLSVQETLEDLNDLSSFMLKQAKFHALDAVHDMATHGGKRIETLEEKQKIEDQNKICIGGFTVEEVTEVRGRLVSAEEYMNNNAITAMIAELRQTAKDLKQGTISPADLSPEMADRLKFWKENGKEITEIMNNPSQYGPLGDMKVRQAMLQLMGDDMPYPESYRNPKIIFGQPGTSSPSLPPASTQNRDLGASMGGQTPAFTLPELQPQG